MSVMTLGMHGTTFTGDPVMVVVTCPNCHIVHAIPQTLERAARADQSQDIHCPLGHTWHYPGRTVEQRLEAERARAGRLAAQLDQAQASARAYRGAATRARRERDRLGQRVAAGVCPCCNRTFKQLARHMASQHPEFAESDGG